MRASGILLPVSSLPSKYGIGCFSKSAFEWIDFLQESGQTFWQILPLGPTSYGDSPYQSFSTFAGNPYFISLEELIAEGLLTREECETANLGTNPSYVDYEKQYENRNPLLHKAYENSKKREDADFLKFEEEQKAWLPDILLDLLGSCFEPSYIRRTAGRTFFYHRLLIPTIVTHQISIIMQVQ